MRPAKEILQADIILADGAMGTYYAQLSGNDPSSCEMANLDNPDLIRRIHHEYLVAGARLLRTNTFAAAAQLGASDTPRLQAVVKAAFTIANECAGDLAYVAADIGPVYNLNPPDDQAAIMAVLDVFFELSADLFIFETFADPDEIMPFCQIIRERSNNSVIIASFALSADGFTRKGLSLLQLSQELDNNPAIDLWGVNCGIGPVHLKNNVQKLPPDGKPLSLMPNSGYPRLENQRLIYGSTPEYFAKTLIDLAVGRTRLLGGCCGTTPRHIEALHQLLAEPSSKLLKPVINNPPPDLPEIQPIRNHFAEKLIQNEFVVICELDPPRDGRMDKMIAAARQLQLAGIDALTLADSPMARVKMDSISCAARLFRDTGMPVLPHLCCRDRNVNGLRSCILAAHSEGIRQILAITGDAIPESDQGFVKPVFNLNSIGLLQLIQRMNQELFAADPILSAAALDPGVANPTAELARVSKKVLQGATVFLTQPIYSSEGIALIRQVRSMGVKVIIGLMPLVSFRNAQYMSQEVPGIRIPASILNRFNPDATQAESIETGIQITLETASAIRADADGFYLIAPFNHADIIISLMRAMRRNGLM